MANVNPTVESMSTCRLCKSPALRYHGTERFSCSSLACPMSRARLLKQQWEMLNSAEIKTGGK